MKTDYKIVFFDFDGVLCKDYFYANLKKTYPDVYNFIQKEIFGGNNKIINQWTRNQISSDDVNKFISEKTKINFQKLSEMFIESVKQMKIEKRLIDLAQNLQKNNIKIALITNNVDIFSRVIVKHNNLDKIFPMIINSADYGILKHEQNGKLFDIVLKKLGETEYKKVLLIDDSVKAGKIFENKGGLVFTYDNFENFELWVKKNFKILELDISHNS